MLAHAIRSDVSPFVQLASMRRSDVALRLANAIEVSQDYHQLFAALRYDHAMRTDDFASPIAGYLDGWAFAGWTLDDHADFVALQELAWQYRMSLHG